MAWTLHSVTIHPPDGGFSLNGRGIYSRQHVLDASEDTVGFFGAGGHTAQLNFILAEDSNSGTGRSTLESARDAGTSVALVSDQGAEGSFKIEEITFTRRMANNHTLPVWECSAQLIPV